VRRWQPSWALDEQARSVPDLSGPQIAAQLVLLVVAAGCFGLAVAGVFLTGLLVPATFFLGAPWHTESLLAVSAVALIVLGLLRHRG
jgi:hypothetical protein